jgi:hypothetical protein
MAERRTHTIQGVACAQPPGDGDFDLGHTIFGGNETSGNLPLAEALEISVSADSW